MQEERDLVHRAQEGDRDAFARLYEGYFDRVFRYVYARVGNRMEAEDMTQQVFLKAYRSLASFRWKGVPFAAWLFRIARNQVVDHVRRQSKRRAMPLDEALVAGDDSLHRTVERRLEFERVVVAARRLTEAQREVINLRFASGLAISEVARTLGKSEGAVKALQHSAIAALRRYLATGEEDVRP